jgi:hypothetical protein
MENIEENLEKMFFKRYVKIERMVEIAKKLIALADKGQLTKESWKNICKEENISPMQYYWILKTLRAHGLIYKFENKYISHRALTSALSQMKDSPQVTSNE